MWDPRDNWAQQGSFVSQVPVPASDPNSPPFVCVEFNQEWQPYICGALQQLCQPTSWANPTPAQLEAVLIAAQELVETFGIATLCTPSCAGMDPAHQSSFQMHINASSVVDELIVGAGQTKGGVPVSYPGATLPITGPGTWFVSVSAAGVLSLTLGTAIPSGNIIIATMDLSGSGGVLDRYGFPDVIYPYRAASGFYPSLPMADPMVLPQPATIADTQYNNPLTPAGDTSGHFAYDPSVPNWYPVNVLQFPAVHPPASWANPLCVWSIGSDNGGGAHPTVPAIHTSIMPALTSNNLVSGTAYDLAFSMPPWPSFAGVPTFFLGNTDYRAFISLGGSPFGAGWSYVGGPRVTVTFNLSSC